MSLSLTGHTPIVQIPRCYATHSQEASKHELCGFSGASLKAYAAVVYLWVECETGSQVSFVASKTRVSPLIQLSIPRLELLAALLLARLIFSVTQALKDEIHLSNPSCYTDSTVALWWIMGKEKVWKPFVQNCVNEIRSLLPSMHWSHCSAKKNPADLPTSGLTVQELKKSSLWWNGPDWLKDKIPLIAQCLKSAWLRWRIPWLRRHMGYLQLLTLPA